MRTQGPEDNAAVTALYDAPLHLGSLHAWETVLLGAVAFGPLVVLVLVVLGIRRRDAARRQQGTG